MTGVTLGDKWLLLPNLLARSLAHEWRETNDPGCRLDGLPPPLPCSFAIQRYAQLRCELRCPGIASSARGTAPTGDDVSTHLASFIDRARQLAREAQTAGALSPTGVVTASEISATERPEPTGAGAAAAVQHDEPALFTCNENPIHAVM